MYGTVSKALEGREVTSLFSPVIPQHHYGATAFAQHLVNT